MTKRSLPNKSILCAAALACGLTSSNAALLVYEGFNYGGSTITNINGTAETGTGLQGSWTVTNVLPVSGGLASSAYQISGLSFGSNFASSTGGALLQTTRYSTTNAQTSATVRLDVSSTGTLWGSYLVNYTTLGNAASGAAIQGISTTNTGATVNLGNRVNTNATAGNTTTSVFYDSLLTTSTASSLIATNTNYLVLSRFTNVGTVLSGGSPGVATTWYFTQAGYDSWYTAGGALEANLGTYAVKFGVDSVSSGQFDFDSNGYLTLKADAPDNNSSQVVSIFDEIRYGTALTDVTIPEPSAALLFGAGVSVVLFGRKRRI